MLKVAAVLAVALPAMSGIRPAHGALAQAQAQTAPDLEVGATAAPVVLIHGWHAIGDDTLAGSAFAQLGTWLAAQGRPVYWAPRIGDEPGDGLDANAAQLAQFLSSVAVLHPGRPIDLVAHSYGGLVARAYLEGPRYAQAKDQGVRVANLVTLGTPMAGIELWTPLLFVLGNPLVERSVWELLPEHMAQFNATHHQPPDVSYTLIVGDARPQTPLLWLLPASDGAVSVASGRALNPRAGAKLAEPLTTDIHADTDQTRFFGWHSYLSYIPTFANVIWPALGNQTAPKAGTGGSEARDGAIDEDRSADEDVAADENRLADKDVAAPGQIGGPVQSARLGPGERRRWILPADGASGVLVGAMPGVTTDLAPLGQIDASAWLPPTIQQSLENEDALGLGFGVLLATPGRADPLTLRLSRPVRLTLPTPSGQLGGTLAAMGVHGTVLTAANSSAQEATLAWYPIYPAGMPSLIGANAR